MGALTSKPYAFSARPWELLDIFAVDYLDTLHAPVRLSTRGGELLRILPDLRYSSLNEWISDRARFSYDSISSNRGSAFTFPFRNRLCAFSVSAQYLSNFLFTRSFLFARPSFDFFGFGQALFGARISGRLGRQLSSSAGDFRSPSNFDPLTALVSPAERAIFVIGLSVRYTHPVLFARLKQLRKLGCTVFSFGESLTTFDYSLGSSLENFFLFFRFRARSAVLAGDAVYITSSKLFRNFSTFFSSKSVLALEESPATACSTEFGLRLTCSRASKWDLLFSPYASGTSAFTIPVAHFYETKSLLFSSLSPTLVCAESTLPSAYFFYDLFTSFFYESQFAVPAALPTSLADDKTTPRFDVPVQAASVYSTYNYYDHFFGHAALRNSTNILLTLRRNEDYRHTHLCSF